MKVDVVAYVQKCDKCQRFSVQHVPITPMQNIVSLLPFATWGIDIMGPFTLATGQRKFPIVVINYFTKWVEAEPLATIIKASIENSYEKSVICRFFCQEF